MSRKLEQAILAYFDANDNLNEALVLNNGTCDMAKVRALCDAWARVLLEAERIGVEVFSNKDGITVDGQVYLHPMEVL